MTLSFSIAVASHVSIKLPLRRFIDGDSSPRAMVLTHSARGAPCRFASDCKTLSNNFIVRKLKKPGLARLFLRPAFRASAQKSDLVLKTYLQNLSAITVLPIP